MAGLYEGTHMNQRLPFRQAGSAAKVDEAHSGAGSGSRYYRFKGTELGADWHRCCQDEGKPPAGSVR